MSRISGAMRPYSRAGDRGRHAARGATGSPVDLRYRFRLERGLIAALEISP